MPALIAFAGVLGGLAVVRWAYKTAQKVNHELEEARLARMAEGMRTSEIPTLRRDPVTARIPIIFVTAFDKYAVRAFELAAIDYLLKPLSPEDLMRSVSRIRGKKSHDTAARVVALESHFKNLNDYEKIAINALEGTHFVRLRDIVRMEGSDNYTFIFVKDEKFTASKTMKYFEDLLLPYNFFRTHKKHLVNLNCIKTWKREDGGLLVLEDGSKIEVARRRRPDFAEAVRRLELNVG